MSLFPSTLTGRVLDDGVTEPPVIELQGISAGQLSLVLTQYTPLETSTQHTADIGTNAAAIAALQGQVAALPAAPDLTPYALAADLSAAEGLIAANGSGLTAVNTSLTLGLASKANQSALDALQVQVDGKSTPASVDLKLANHPTTAAMNSSIASTNNATLATVAATYALKTVVDQLAMAARQTAADVDQRVATALLSYLTQTAYQAGQALQDARLDGHDTEILALQNAGPFATAGDLSNLQVTLQSAIDGILAEIATLGGATNLVNAPAWVGNVTWDLLAGTNQIRNLHATGPLSIALANDDWTLSFGCDAYTTQESDDAIAAALTNYFTRTEVTATIVAAIDESKGYTDTQLVPYSTTTQMNQAISDALVPYGTAAQRDAAIVAALVGYYDSTQTDAAIVAALASFYTSAQTDAAIAAAALSNGQSWTGGPTFNLLRGSNVLRNLSVAGALTASFQNLDDTILIESDSYARSETYTQLETGAAITAAIDALDLSQFQNEAEVQALIAAALVPYWDQTEVSTYVAGELQVDSKIITALLDFYTRTEVDQQITNALGNVDLSSYFTQAETQTYVANELLAFYPQTELDSQLTATFTQYWTSGRTQTEIDDAIAGAGFLTQAQADTRYFAVSANASFESLVRTNVTPPQIKALLPRAPLAANTILTDTTLELTCDAFSKAESDGRYLSSSSFAPLDARYFARNPAVAEGNGLFHLVQDQFTPQFIRSLLFRPPLTGGAILGNGSVIEIEADCWSKAQSDSRYPLVATFNSLGSTVTSIDGRVTALENAPGVAPTADLTVNSLTATAICSSRGLSTCAPLLPPDRLRKGRLASGAITPFTRRVSSTSTPWVPPVTVSTLAAGSQRSSGACTRRSLSICCVAVMELLLVKAPVAAVEPTKNWAKSAVVALSVRSDRTVMSCSSPMLPAAKLVVPNGSVGIVARNAAATGDASLILDSNAQNGLVELKALAGGGVQMNTLFQFMSFNTTNGLANLAIEPNIGGSNNGELIFGYGFVNLSDKALKTNVRDLSEKELQETFDAVEPRMYDRIEGGKDQIGFIAQEVQATPREGLQDQETGRPGADDARLPEAQRGPLGRGEVPAEAGREAGEEKARALLNGGAGGDRAAAAAGPGL